MSSPRAQALVEAFEMLSDDEREEFIAELVERAQSSEDPELLRTIEARIESYDRGEAVLHEPHEVARYIRSKYQRV